MTKYWSPSVSLGESTLRPSRALRVSAKQLVIPSLRPLGADSLGWKHHTEWMGERLQEEWPPLSSLPEFLISSSTDWNSHTLPGFTCTPKYSLFLLHMIQTCRVSSQYPELPRASQTWAQEEFQSYFGGKLGKIKIIEFIAKEQIYVNKIKALIKSHFLKRILDTLMLHAEHSPTYVSFLLSPSFPTSPLCFPWQFCVYLCVYHAIHTQMLLCIYIKSRDHKRKKTFLSFGKWHNFVLLDKKIHCAFITCFVHPLLY